MLCIILLTLCAVSFRVGPTYMSTFDCIVKFSKEDVKISSTFVSQGTPIEVYVDLRGEIAYSVVAIMRLAEETIIEEPLSDDDNDGIWVGSIDTTQIEPKVYLLTVSANISGIIEEVSVAYVTVEPRHESYWLVYYALLLLIPLAVGLTLAGKLLLRRKEKADEGEAL